jgi:coenzyme F420-reducing hydrogenase alpha subunit
MSRWLDVFGEYTAVRGYRIVTVTTDPLAAMTEVVAGRADRILTGSDHELRPLVEMVTGQPVDIPASQRRPRRLR